MTEAPPVRSLIERLARHLAMREDGDWPDHVEDAASLLALMKDADPVMIAAGDADIWRRMIDAALTERWSIGGALSLKANDAPAPGSDEEGEIALEPDHVAEGARSQASWIHVANEGE